MRILILDNYDSFVYNLVQFIGELGAEPFIRKNDCIGLDEIQHLNPCGIIISPGPGTPEKPRDIGICLDVIKANSRKTPTLGVCLGHQAIILAFGGKIVQAKSIMHGKTSEIVHNGTGIFKDIKNPLRVMRYHSLTADSDTFPHDNFTVIAKTTKEEEIFAVRHKEYPIYGVQFHPESIGTEDGKSIIKNFLEICNDKRSG